MTRETRFLESENLVDLVGIEPGQGTESMYVIDSTIGDIAVR